MRFRRQAEQWFYCLIHHEPESGVKCPNISRLGPFRSADEAMAAINRMNERNQDLDMREQLDDQD